MGTSRYYPTSRDEIGKEDDKWDDGKMHELKIKLEELRQFNATLEEPDKEVEKNIMLEKRKVKINTIELIANEMYDKIIMLINERRERLGIKGVGAYQKL